MEREEEMRIRAIVDERYKSEIATVRVSAAILDSPKHISEVVKLLNELVPVPKLQHLKRVKRDQEKSYVIVDLVEEEEEEEEAGDDLITSPKRAKPYERGVLEKLEAKGLNYEKLGVTGVGTWEVPKYGPKTKIQYEKAMKYWPVNFHPEKRLERMMGEKVFEKAEWKYHVENMKEVLKMAEERKVNATMILSGGDGRVVAMGFDRVGDHPLQHAIMVAVDGVARTQNGGAWKVNIEDLGSEGKIPERAPGEEAPYLCTGYDAYVALEPCVMCAMALVHSRIKRVFFHFRNPRKGALISRCQVHTLEKLNHHFEVFEVTK